MSYLGTAVKIEICRVAVFFQIDYGVGGGGGRMLKWRKGGLGEARGNTLANVDNKEDRTRCLLYHFRINQNKNINQLSF